MVQKYKYFVLILILQSCGQKDSNQETHPTQKRIEVGILAANEDVYDLIKAAIQINEIKGLENGKVRVLESLPADSYAYSFLNDNELLEKYTRFDTVSLYQTELLRELNSMKSYKIDSSKLPELEIFPMDSIDFKRPYDENKNIEPFLLFYSPLISVDGKIAIISIHHVCFGLCGKGWSLILMKENDDWIKIGEIYRWVS